MLLSSEGAVLGSMHKIVLVYFYIFFTVHLTSVLGTPNLPAGRCWDKTSVLTDHPSLYALSLGMLEKKSAH